MEEVDNRNHAKGCKPLDSEIFGQGHENNHSYSHHYHITVNPNKEKGRKRPPIRGT